MGGPFKPFLEGEKPMPRDFPHFLGIGVRKPWSRSHCSSKTGHRSSAATPAPIPLPCSPWRKICNSAGTPAVSKAL